MARPRQRLLHLVLESHGGRALVPIPKRSASPRPDVDTAAVVSLKCLTPNGRLEKWTYGKVCWKTGFDSDIRIGAKSPRTGSSGTLPERQLRDDLSPHFLLAIRPRACR